MPAEIIILKPGPKNWREQIWRKLHACKSNGKPRGASRPDPRKPPTPPRAA